MKPINLPDAYNLAKALIDQEKDKNIDRVRLQNFRQILDGQSSPSQQADSDQLNEPNQPDPFGEDEPIHSAETAKSITDSDLQTRHHKNNQAIQHNRYSAAVVDPENEEKKEILVSLGYLGIAYLKAKEIIEKHGHKRVAEIAQHTKDQNCKKLAGYLIRALAENWTFWSKPEKEDYAYGNAEAYIMGKYATFIQH